MIYYLPERIYEILKNDNDVINILLEIEEKFEEFTDFKSYIMGYSKLYGDHNTVSLYIKANNLIRNKIYGNKFLIKEFDINEGDVSFEDMKHWYFFGNESTGIDLENKFFLLSNIINKAADHDVYEHFMERYVDLYEHKDQEYPNEKLSKYIHLKYMYSKMYIMAMNMNTLEQFSSGWEHQFIEDCHRIYKTTLSITNDNDITTNYYLEALSTAIKRANYNRELLGIGEDISWLNTVKDYITLRWRDEDTELDFQYRMQSVGYLFVLDEIATLYCLNGNKIEFNFVLEKIVDYINNALTNEKKLLRGLFFYDKVNHNMFASMIRKYLKVLAGIKTVLKINGLSQEDKKYILSENLGDIAANTPNRIQEKRTVKSVDATAEAMVKKQLEIEM